MDTQRAVDARALEAKEGSKVNGCPLRVRGTAIYASLVALAIFDEVKEDSFGIFIECHGWQQKCGRK